MFHPTAGERLGAVGARSANESTSAAWPGRAPLPAPGPRGTPWKRTACPAALSSECLGGPIWSEDFEDLDLVARDGHARLAPHPFFSTIRPRLSASSFPAGWSGDYVSEFRMARQLRFAADLRRQPIRIRHLRPTRTSKARGFAATEARCPLHDEREQVMRMGATAPQRPAVARRVR